MQGITTNLGVGLFDVLSGIISCSVFCVTVSHRRFPFQVLLSDITASMVIHILSRLDWNKSGNSLNLELWRFQRHKFLKLRMWMIIPLDLKGIIR